MLSQPETLHDSRDSHFLSLEYKGTRLIWCSAEARLCRTIPVQKKACPWETWALYKYIDTVVEMNDKQRRGNFISAARSIMYTAGAQRTITCYSRKANMPLTTSRPWGVRGGCKPGAVRPTKGRKLRVAHRLASETTRHTTAS